MGFNAKISKVVEYLIEDCYKCGGPIAMTEPMRTVFKRDKSTFYCVNGHGQVYTTNEADKLRQELEAERRRRVDAHDRANRAEAELLAAQRAAKRAEKRAKAGTCPCCHRTFQQMARHMKAKHPDFAKEKGNG